MRDSDRSAGLWLVSFAATASAALCGRFGWLPALLGGGLGALAFRVRLHRGRIPPAVRKVQALWLAVPLSIAANSASTLFPDGGHSLYVPAVVLGLSWLLCCHRRSGVLSCCAVAGFFVLGALGIVALCAVPDLKIDWLRPEFHWMEALTALSLAAGGMFLCEAVPDICLGPGWRWASALVPAVLSALTAGGLSRPLAARQASAFYTLSRSVSLFGVAERFEALIAACLTLGVCSACALLLCAAGGGSRVRAALALAALILSRRPIPGPAAAAGTAIFWVIFPVFFAQKPAKKKTQKKSEKDEKST